MRPKCTTDLHSKNPIKNLHLLLLKTQVNSGMLIVYEPHPVNVYSHTEYELDFLLINSRCHSNFPKKKYC